MADAEHASRAREEGAALGTVRGHHRIGCRAGQPQLPASPILTCIMLTQGLAPFMGALVRLFATLPAWIRVDQDRLMVNLRQRVKDAGGKLALCNMSSRLLRVFQTCSLERLFIIKSDREEAVKAVER